MAFSQTKFLTGLPIKSKSETWNKLNTVKPDPFYGNHKLKKLKEIIDTMRAPTIWPGSLPALLARPA